MIREGSIGEKNEELLRRRVRIKKGGWIFRKVGIIEEGKYCVLWKGRKNIVERILWKSRMNMVGIVEESDE